MNGGVIEYQVFDLAPAELYAMFLESTKHGANTAVVFTAFRKDGEVLNDQMVQFELTVDEQMMPLSPGRRKMVYAHDPDGRRVRITFPSQELNNPNGIISFEMLIAS